MKTYLVGGAVRDTLLGLPVRERDWLVSNCSAEMLRHKGFQQVGQHFAVFLHPQTHEEYALPRAARGAPANSAVSVEDDLQRRDLTINAMAFDDQQKLIDPLNGKQDLEQRILRHTPAFRDDPVRVLRLARFAARFHSMGFSIAPETRLLVKGMVSEGDLDQLVPERVFSEIAKAMRENHPVVFIETLRELDVLRILLPEVDRLFGIPQPAQHHPEIDTGIHTLMVLQQASRLSPLPEVRFAALLHDVGKGTTPEQEWPRHIAHEARGVPLVEQIAMRLRLPNSWRDLALAVTRHHLNCHRALELRPATVLKMLNRLDALRRAERFEQFLLVCKADMRGRTGFEQSDYPQQRYLLGALQAAQAVDTRQVAALAKSSGQIAEQIARARAAAIADYKARWKAQHANHNDKV